MTLAETLSLIGSAASVIGVCVAIWQIRRVLRTAQAAELAARMTQRAVQRDVLLADLSSCSRTLDEVRAHVRTERIEAALLRVSDVVSQLAQLRRLIQRRPENKGILREALTQLQVLRDQLERVLAASGSAKFEPAQANKVLSVVSDDLNSMIGDIRYSSGVGDEDGE